MGLVTSFHDGRSDDRREGGKGASLIPFLDYFVG
jgi:hypothetical protein